MHDDHRDGGEGHGGPGHDHGQDHDHGHGHGHDHDHGHDHGHDCRAGSARDGSGGDTRGLQLEMSQVLYSEAEGVTKEAFRQLLLEAAKAHWRERFGDQITALAHLAVDELMSDVLYSLDVEGRIQGHNEGRPEMSDELRAIFAGRGAADEPKPEQGGGRTRKTATRRKRSR